MAGLFRIRAFAVLFGAELQSVVGDQLARVALSILVFRETSSPFATGMTYAATYVPAIAGGFLIAGLGDRYSRKVVMIGCDLARALLFVAMVLTDPPLPLLIALLCLAMFVGPAFSAAQVSYLAGALDAEQFRSATGLRMISNQGAQVLGFACGGVLVGVLGPHATLLIDAGTYLISALLIAVLLGAEAQRPSERIDESAKSPDFAGLWREPHLRALVGLSALAGLFIVPEGLAVPFGVHAGASAAGVGVMLAAIPLGGALGAAIIVRLVLPQHRAVVANWMAVGCGLPLVLSALAPHWPLAASCWLVSGMLAAYQVETVTAIVHLTPDARRAQTVGAASAVLLGSQGLGLLAFAGVARVVPVEQAVALAGILGSALALALVLGPLRRSGAARQIRRAAPFDRST